MKRLFQALRPEAPKSAYGILALVIPPAAVFMVHAIFSNHLFVSGSRQEVVVPGADAPPQVVFAARLGECTDKGAYTEGSRGVLVPATVTVWMRNFDGWLMDRAEGNEALLEGSGFTAESYRNFLSIRSRKGSVHTLEEELGFQKWLEGLAKINETSPLPGLSNPDSLSSLLEHSRRNAGKVPVALDEDVLGWHHDLIAVVSENQQLLKDYKQTGNTPHSLESFTSFLGDRGLDWPTKLKGEKELFSTWLEDSRQNLGLTIGGRIFSSLKPDANSNSKLSGSSLKGQTSDDTIQILHFRRVGPSELEAEEWRNLIVAYGVDSRAPLTVGLEVVDNNGAAHSLRMPTIVNGGSTSTNSPLVLPLRPVVMRSIAWAALAGVLWFIVLVSLKTGTLRSSVPADHPEIKSWLDSPWSASRVVFAWWLAICTGCYLFLWAMKAQMGVLSGSAPLLLGINGGTLLASAFVGGGKPLCKSRSFLEDIVSEGGEAEISRLQMLVWNGVLGLIFIWQSLAEWKMPTFDAHLITLLGISATAYVGYKAAKPVS